MHISKQFIKPFLNMKTYFMMIWNNIKALLPICSINLQCIEPELDEWVHIVSAKEIHDGCGDSPNHFTQILRKQIH